MTRLTALLIAVGLLLVPVPVAAGGPTSVMLAAPDFDRTASLYHSDPLYDRLQGLVESNVVSGEVGKDGWSENSPHARGPLVRATWLAHDMYVWRIDRIYPNAPGGPWIATSLHDSTKPMTEGKVFWNRPSDSRGLLQVLAQLKLLGPTAQKTVPAPVPEEPSGTGAAAPSQTVVKSGGVLTGWRWSLAGLLVGVLLTVAAHRLVRRQARSPRWELIG